MLTQNNQIGVGAVIEQNRGRRLSEFCTFPERPLQIIQRHLSGQGIQKTLDVIKQELSEDFSKCVEESKLQVSNGRISFVTRYLRSDNMPVEITLKRSSNGSAPLFLYYVCVGCEASAVDPGHAFEAFAYLKNWSTYLAELSSKVMPEIWSFVDGRENSILCLYLKYTFYRLQRENKIAIAKDGSFAAFNTGLVDCKYNDVYACFVPNDASDSETDWKAAGFCTAAAKGIGKTLVEKFNPLPSAATYFKTFRDIYFDASQPVLVDYEHIIIDNLERLPLDFLCSCAMGVDEVQRLTAQLKSSRDVARKKQAYAELRGLILKSDQLFLRVQNQLEAAVATSVHHAEHDYHVVVPSYSPRANKTMLLLPLHLTHSEQPDVTLVVEPTLSGNYQGHTVLTLQQAYVDARLICKLSSSWLTDNI